MMNSSRSQVWRRTIGSLFPVLVALVLISCSEERVPNTLPPAHPDAWMTASSADFHGEVVRLNGFAACVKCHNLESSGGKSGIACTDCHGPNGTACTGCHGGVDNQTGAPPEGLRGELSDTALAVGAHSIHLTGSGVASALACSTCHIVPVLFADTAHFDLDRPPGQALDSIAEITWHGISDPGGATWDRSSRACSGTYCHGNFAGGTVANAPVWTGTNQAACGSCHDVGGDAARLLWKHDFHVNQAGLFCADCHFAVVDTVLAITDPSLHVNGIADTLTRDVALCDQCHGSGPGSCTSCHGGLDNQTGAPPAGLRGESSTTDLAVGAHTAHVSGGSLAVAFECSECHLIPSSIAAPGHLGADSVAELTWGSLAGSTASWNRATATCSGVYCHGSFAGGTASNAPIWTGTDQAACGTCHDVGSDPASLLWKHEAHVGVGLSCGECHASVTDTLLAIIDPVLHVNGQVDTLTRDPSVCESCHGSGPGACTACHGGTDNVTGAPPVGLRGETTTADRAVGAHTTHLEGGSQADAFACSDCHTVPTSLTTPGHLGADSVAEMTWSTLSGPSANWERTSESCGSTYCHGNFAGGTAGNAPVWTGTNQAECGSCHDLGANSEMLGWKHEFHIKVALLDCVECHANVTNASLDIIDLTLHVNGVADTLTRDTTVCNACHGSGPTACTLCHGGTDNVTGAPPVGLEGESLPSQLAVGAHTAHMEDGVMADAFACDECHLVPAALNSPGHLGADSIAEVTWNTLAGPTADWNRVAAVCNNVYCHGEFPGGDGTNSPLWTGSNQATCGSCHDVGSDPAQLQWKHQYHVAGAGLACEDCHASVVNDQLDITDLTLHVNGIADTLTRDPDACVSCHGPAPGSCITCHGGGDNLTGAPPLGLEGETLTSQRAVGAHTTHLEGGAVADAFACSDCHLVPGSLFSPGHLGADSVAELVWSTLAGSASSWNALAASCSNTYCHGEFSGGDGNNEPVWTGSNQADCGSCHDVGTNPRNLGGRHEKHVQGENLDCRECHVAVIDQLENIVGRDLHVDGKNDVAFLRGGTYNGGSCTGLNGAACHGRESW